MAGDQGTRRKSNSEIDAQFDAILNKTEFVFVGASTEFFDDQTFIVQPVQITIQPGVYNIGYTAFIESRISGSGVDEWVRRYAVLRDQSNNLLAGSQSTSYVFIEDDGDNNGVDTQTAFIPEVTISQATTLTLWLAAKEDPDSGGGQTGTVLRGSGFVVDGIDMANTRLWAQKIREL